MSNPVYRPPTQFNFDEVFVVPWEQAFYKFGYQDGAFPMTGFVAGELEDEDYIVTFEAWGLHNDVITSIMKDDQELIPATSIKIGYDNPRNYLPDALVSLLDQQFYC